MDHGPARVLQPGPNDHLCDVCPLAPLLALGRLGAADALGRVVVPELGIAPVVGRLGVEGDLANLVRPPLLDVALGPPGMMNQPAQFTGPRRRRVGQEQERRDHDAPHVALGHQHVPALPVLAGDWVPPLVHHFLAGLVYFPERHQRPAVLVPVRLDAHHSAGQLPVHHVLGQLVEGVDLPGAVQHAASHFRLHAILLVFRRGQHVPLRPVPDEQGDGGFQEPSSPVLDHPNALFGHTIAQAPPSIHPVPLKPLVARGEHDVVHPVFFERPPPLDAVTPGIHDHLEDFRLSGLRPLGDPERLDDLALDLLLWHRRDLRFPRGTKGAGNKKAAAQECGSTTMPPLGLFLRRPAVISGRERTRSYLNLPSRTKTRKVPPQNGW